MRLSQYLAQCGVCSRRQASRLIEAQRVQFLGRIALHTDQLRQPLELRQTQTIFLDGALISPPETKAYYLYYKPVGIDCKLIDADPSSLIHHLPPSPRLYPAGRLDKDSRGLLLLTNDGQLCQQLMHPSFEHSKTYQITLDRPFDDEFLAQMQAGVSYAQAGKTIHTLPCVCQRLSATCFEIVLTQGMNRQIRRMCQALGYRVIDLLRTKLMTLQLNTCNAIEQTKELMVGEMRPLTDAEYTQLCAALKRKT